MENWDKVSWSIALDVAAEYEKLEIDLTTQALEEIVKKFVERY